MKHFMINANITSDVAQRNQCHAREILFIMIDKRLITRDSRSMSPSKRNRIKMDCSSHPNFAQVGIARMVQQLGYIAVFQRVDAR